MDRLKKFMELIEADAKMFEEHAKVIDQLIPILVGQDVREAWAARRDGMFARAKKLRDSIGKVKAEW